MGQEILGTRVNLILENRAAVKYMFVAPATIIIHTSEDPLLLSSSPPRPGTPRYSLAQSYYPGINSPHVSGPPRGPN